MYDVLHNYINYIRKKKQIIVWRLFKSLQMDRVLDRIAILTGGIIKYKLRNI